MTENISLCVDKIKELIITDYKSKGKIVKSIKINTLASVDVELGDQNEITISIGRRRKINEEISKIIIDNWSKKEYNIVKHHRNSGIIV